MNCQRCGTINKQGSRFCENCGAEIAAQPINARPSMPSPPQSVCAKCGAANADDSLFCYSCGTRLQSETTQSKAEAPAPAVSTNTSGAWWLLPFILGWLGGLIGFLAVRQRNRKKALGLLWAGIIVTLLELGLGIALPLISYHYLQL
jgi:uncharacterized membrane protein YvbJ